MFQAPRNSQSKYRKQIVRNTIKKTSEHYYSFDMEPEGKLVVIGEKNCFYNVFWKVNGGFNEYRIRQCVPGCWAKIRLFNQTYMFGEEEQEEDECTKIIKKKFFPSSPSIEKCNTV